MNPRWERFRAGTPWFSRTLIWPGGRRVMVCDRAQLARRVARCMDAQGLSEREIACALGRSRTFVARVRAFRI